MDTAFLLGFTHLAGTQKDDPLTYWNKFLNKRNLRLEVGLFFHVWWSWRFTRSFLSIVHNSINKCDFCGIKGAMTQYLLTYMQVFASHKIHFGAQTASCLIYGNSNIFWIACPWGVTLGPQLSPKCPKRFMTFGGQLCKLAQLDTTQWMKVLRFPMKIYPFEIFTRATPGSSLVGFIN